MYFLQLLLPDVLKGALQVCFLLWCLLPLHPCSASKAGCVPAKALQGLNEGRRMIVMFEHVN